MELNIADTPRSQGPSDWHGTAENYWRGCRCLPCRAALSAYRRAPNGRIEAVDEAITIIRRLQAGRMGIGRIAQVSGVGVSTIHDILNRRYTKVRTDVLDKLRATKIDRAGGDLVSAWKTEKAIKALLAEGYTRAYLRRRLGRHLNFSDRVRVATERKVLALYYFLTS